MSNNNNNNNVILPPGWLQVKDEATGRIYYCNPRTRESRWDPPSVAMRPPVPAFQQEHLPMGGGSGSAHTSSQGSTDSPHLQTAQHERLLVPKVRAMMDKIASFPEQSEATNLELTSVSVGEISDLCYLQHIDDDGKGEPYKPINPYTMSVKAKRPDIEEGRIDTRLVELKKTLMNFGGSPPQF
jgi:hypothetical protein